jgi:hypothetical protein
VVGELDVQRAEGMVGMHPARVGGAEGRGLDVRDYDFVFCTSTSICSSTRTAAASACCGAAQREQKSSPWDH